MVFLAALLVVGVVSGATAAVVGFGIGSLMTPLLFTRLPPTLAVAAVAIPHLVATAIRFFQHRRAVDSTVMTRFGLPSAAGGLAGALLLGTVEDVWLFTLLGVLLIATAIANLTSGFGGWKPSAAVALGLGLLSGLFGGLVGNQGGLRAAGLLAFDLAPRPYLATGTTVALLVDAARITVYLFRAGSDLATLLGPITIATGGCIAGTIIGEKLFLGMSTSLYRRVVGTAVAILGGWLLYRALTF